MPESSQTRLSRLKSAVIPQEGAIRILSLATLINTFGNGLFVTIEVIYFTFHVGLAPAQVALGLSIGGGISLLFGVPAGHIADRFGPRDITVFAYISEGLVLITFIFVHSFWPFVFVSLLAGITGAVSGALRMATIAQFGVGEERVRVRAFTRAVTNLGIGLGTVFAGIALAVNTNAGYVTMLILDALTYFAAGYVWHKLPYVAPTVARGEPVTFNAFRDRKFLAATAINGIMSLHFILQNVAIPLWVVQETSAPRWWVAVIMLVNTIAVILFQVRASRGAGDINIGARLYARSGALVAVSCLIYALSAGVSKYLACALLILAMLVHVAGELLGSVGSWSIGFGLADQNHQGQYQAVYSLGPGFGGAFGPSIVTALVIGLGKPGWVVLAIIFFFTSLAMRRLVTGSWSKTNNETH
ncbi:MAG: MFS transporter [Candidatus Nanopelagicaceae bacterium]|nr:MFS transporter [Candidatus Nanopelagicaceae bacterium]